MSDHNQHTARASSNLKSRIEVNPLLQFLGRGSGDGRVLPVQTQIKRVLLHQDSGLLLQSLVRASRARVYATLAFLEIADAEMSVEAILSFLTQASDNTILELVLAQVEGFGTTVCAGLKAALKRSGPIGAHAIGILNRLIVSGCNLKAALNAASIERHMTVRSNFAFVERHRLHPLTSTVAHLCESECEMLALDSLFDRLARRAPDLLPAKSKLLRLESLNGLRQLLKHDILRYRRSVPVPQFHHPRLELIDSIPRMRAVGRALNNCMGASATYQISMVLGRSIFAIYAAEQCWGATKWTQPYIIHFTLVHEDDQLVASVHDIKGASNSEIRGDDRVKVLNDLTHGIGMPWRLGLHSVINELHLHEMEHQFFE